MTQFIISIYSFANISYNEITKVFKSHQSIRISRTSLDIVCCNMKKLTGKPNSRESSEKNPPPPPSLQVFRPLTSDSPRGLGHTQVMTPRCLPAIFLLHPCWVRTHTIIECGSLVQALNHIVNCAFCPMEAQHTSWKR